MPRPVDNTRNVVIVTGIGHFSTHFFELMFPTLAVGLALESGLPLARVLGWSTLGYFLFGVCALPVGMLADRIGARRLLLVAMGGLGVSSLAMAAAAPGWPIVAGLAAIGVFASIYHPAGMGLIANVIEARGRALGLNGIFGNLAIAGTPVITATLSAQVGWRGAYVVCGLAMCAAAWWCARLPIDERPVDEPDAVDTAGRRANGTRHLFVLVCLTAMLGGIAYRGNTVAQPAYFAAHVDFVSYGTATSLAYLVAVAGQYAGGVIADRADLRWAYLLFHAASLPCLFAMTTLVGAPLLGAASVYVFFALGMQPIENSLLARFTPAGWRATAYGIKCILVFGVGAAAVPLVQWADTAGDLRLAFLVLTGVVALLVAGAGVLVAVSAPVRNRPAAGSEALPGADWQPAQMP